MARWQGVKVALLRKLRGILGTGLTWGAAWAAFFGALGLVISVVDPASIDPGEAPLMLAVFGGGFGLIAGTAFGLLLSFAEGRRRLIELTPGRAAIWGALAAATIPLLKSNIDQVILFCPIGAAVAAATVAIARRSERQSMVAAAADPLALGAGEGLSEALLSGNAERRKSRRRDPR